MTVSAIMAKRAIANRTVHTQNLKKQKSDSKPVTGFQNYHNNMLTKGFQKDFLRVSKHFKMVSSRFQMGFKALKHRVTSNP